MSITTRVIWPMTENLQEVEIMGDVTMADLQTEPKLMTFDTVNDTRTVDRFWIDEASANNWLTYVQDYNPIFAQIIP